MDCVPTAAGLHVENQEDVKASRVQESVPAEASGKGLPRQQARQGESPQPAVWTLTTGRTGAPLG